MEYAKLLIGIEGLGRDQLVARLHRCAEWIRAVRASPDSFAVECRQRDGSFASIRSGTRDYCIGYASALDACTAEVGAYRVVAPAGYVCWPEDDEGWPE